MFAVMQRGKQPTSDSVAMLFSISILTYIHIFVKPIFKLIFCK